MERLPAKPRTAEAPALSHQLQIVSLLVAEVRAGRSLTSALDRVPSADRAGAQALAFAVMRHLGRAMALRRRLARRAPPPPVDALLLTALALLTEEGDRAYKPYVLVDQAVEAAKGRAQTRAQAGFLNACLRRFLQDRDRLIQETDADPEARYNHPRWWIERLQRDHPEHWEAILQADQQAAPLCLRVHRRRIDPESYRERLAAQGLSARRVGPVGLALERSVPVSQLPGFAQGWVSVQDAGAQQAAPLLLDALGERAAHARILDACAAPGGKTAHLLESADVEVTALDVDPARCVRIRENLHRLGLDAEIRAADARQPALWWDGRRFQGILLDAPCTASGIVRRHPDVRWLRRAEDVDALVQTQAELLEALWPLLQPGGVLLYCTCSVFRAEGSDQIEAFLARHTDAFELPAPGHLLPIADRKNPGLPDNAVGEHDGFFYARLQKR
ncbi:16S rRNA (cytosine967-C5)-methyltransferase [Tibeticola sediminis]|uniref:16S rRNA (cytosine(967)-C(5))-methyltransferase n=1 Tax=Tibeticola sediminis TaxID=1917811 RepID=A0A3N4URD0_9BURK|nr:16S rRNA (cytosine(967)-C(5))-methyltransferase RsmB [Tibeticola sediminis]RPE73242.1 16S rRNA (cytosine967-C5)-methyltransferase [Tibeticola sediminis]